MMILPRMPKGANIGYKNTLLLPLSIWYTEITAHVMISMVNRTARIFFGIVETPTVFSEQVLFGYQ